MRKWYHPWLDWLLASASNSGKIHLDVDSTKVSAHCRQVMIAVAYQGRTLPLMWDWVNYSRGHCTTELQLKLFTELQAYLPKAVPVSLVGDGEFNHPLLIEYLEFWGWDYVLRQSKDTLIMQGYDCAWKRFDSFHLERAQPGA